MTHHPAGSQSSLEPPVGEKPGVIGADRVIAARGDASISVGRIEVYSTGFLLTFDIVFPEAPAPGSSDEDQVWQLARGIRTPSQRGLVLGVRYADGAWDSTMDGQPYVAQGDSLLRMDPQSGGNRGERCRFTYWVRPLPEGDLHLFARWLDRDIPLSSVCVSSSEFRTAAQSVR